MLTENLIKFIKYYGQGRKRKIVKYVFLSLVTACFEFMGIALIYPFILLLIQPSAMNFPIHISPYLLGAGAVVLFLVKNIFMIWQVKIQTDFVLDWGCDITKSFMRYFLYSSFKDTSCIYIADKLYILNVLIPNSLNNFILRVINLFVNSAIVVSIISLLFIKFTIAATVATLFTFATLIFQHFYFKKKTSAVAEKITKANRALQANLQETVINLKQVKLSCLEDKFMNEFEAKQKELKELQVYSGIYSGIPPYIIEGFIILSLVALLGIVSILQKNDTGVLIASYAVTVAAIFRIAPALNRIQSSINGLNTTRDFVKQLITKYEEYGLNKTVFESCDKKAEFKTSLKLENANFSYKDSPPVIKNLSLEIKKGEFIGIAGLSGVGKSTLADILTGLLPLDSGKLYIDNREVTSFASLRKLIGYVPQQTVLLGETFAQNVSWGTIGECDYERVAEMLKKTGMYEFILNNYESGLNAIPLTDTVGLSIGQQQRLSIARALYMNPQILILDEATSSLDLQTEYEIGLTLNDLKGKVTILAIAHRLSTLKSCDRLFYMKDGRIADVGTFSELTQKNSDFANLVKLSELNVSNK